MEKEREKTIAEADGYCLECGKVTHNSAVYVGTMLKQRTCLECGEVMAAGPEAMGRAYLKELGHRALKKPEQFAKEWRAGQADFVLSLPFRAVSKSIRELDYLCKLFLPEK